MKINKLEIENVKRVNAVKIEPTKDGLTIIGGKNGQGKTSVLDAIAWALGGEKFRPSEAKRKESYIPPFIRLTMDNGLIVERKGKNSSLKVTDPSGKVGGQSLLNLFIEELALSLPKFMNASSKEKANILLSIIGVEEELNILNRKEKEIYNERTAIGRIADQKMKYASEQQYYPDAPEELISASELILKQQEILARNGENQKKRENVAEYKRLISNLESELAALIRSEEEKKIQLENARKDLSIAQMNIENLVDESTEELEEEIRNTEEINRKVRANLDKEKAEEDARSFQISYDKLTTELEEIRRKKKSLLNNAELPLPELSVNDSEIIYKGQKWDNMSGSEQLKVAVAIIRKMKPDCNFVLIDKLEQMDIDTLEEFGKWLEKEGLQAITTRVSTGDECSIYIEDGYSYDKDGNRTTDIPSKNIQKKEWKAGEF